MLAVFLAIEKMQLFWVRAKKMNESIKQMKLFPHFMKCTVS
jgi:hypothetical protein